jgi:hypothetical protein
MHFLCITVSFFVGISQRKPTVHPRERPVKERDRAGALGCEVGARAGERGSTSNSSSKGDYNNYRQTATREEVFQLLQLRVFCFGFLQDGNVGVGVFPEDEKILVCTLRLGGVAGQRVGASELEMGQCSSHKVQHDASVIQQVLELGGGSICRDAPKDRKTLAPLPPLHGGLKQRAKDAADHRGRARLRTPYRIQRALARLPEQSYLEF